MLSTRSNSFSAAVLALGTTAALAMAPGCERRTPAGEIGERLAQLDRPNLVLVLIDTLRADWTTPYGYTGDTTPELLRWASRGVVFEQARAQSSWTKISMASLLTSLWPRTHSIREPNDGLAENATTLAEALSDAGYRTYGIQTNGWLDQSFGFQQGFDHYVFPSGNASLLPKPSLWPHADRVVEETERLLDAHPPDQPFFLYVHFMDVHEFASPPEFRRFGTGDVGAYLAAIRWADDALERVREILDDGDHLDRTVIVMASDHGEAFGENGTTGHAKNVLTPVLWVPLVLRFPFDTEPIRVGAQVRNLDIAPTLLDIAGIEPPETFEGQSLLPLIAAEGHAGDRPSFAALGFPLFFDAIPQKSMTTGAWTLVRDEVADKPPKEHLYDRSVDPNENVDVIKWESEVAAELREMFDDHLKFESEIDVRETDVRIDPSIAERLRAMGYLQ